MREHVTQCNIGAHLCVFDEILVLIEENLTAEDNIDNITRDINRFKTIN